MSLQFGEKDISAIEEQFKAEQENMKQMLESWIKHKERERAEIKKGSDGKAQERNVHTQESSQNLNSNVATATVKSSSVSPEKSEDVVEDMPIEQQEDNLDNSIKDKDKEEDKNVEVEGEIYVSNTKTKNPNEYLTIAIKVENGTEVKTITRDEASKVENHAVLVDWNEIIPENPKVSDIQSIMDNASSAMKKNLENYRKAPSIQDFKSDINSETGKGADKGEGIDSESITDLLSSEEQNENSYEIDDDIPSIADLVSSEDDKQPSVNDDTPSIADLLSSEEQNENSYEIDDDIPSITDLASSEDDKQPNINDVENAKVLALSTKQNNPEVMEIREDGTIFIGDEYDILSEPQEIEILTLHAMKTIIEEQIEEIEKQHNNRENVAHKEPLALSNPRNQEAPENGNVDNDELEEVEAEYEEIQGIGR
jgi:hypothetical protein